MLDAAKTRELLTKKIDACRKRGFLPPELIDLIEKIYSVQLEARDKAAVPETGTIQTADAVQRSQGAPLVERTRFPFDRKQARELLADLLKVAETATPALVEASAAVTAKLADNSLDLEQAMQAHLDGDEAFFTDWAKNTPTAPRLLPMLVQAAMTPSIEKAATLLAAGIDLKASWPHGHCPVCGSMPIMSELREKEGFRFNICGFCHSEFHAPRLQCPFCLETDTNKLGYYEAKEEPGMRINTCQTCNMYIKLIDFRNLDRRALPLIDDLETLSLDVVAREKKFKRPTLSAWGF